VDTDALPAALVEDLKAGKVNLDDPATTLALLELNSVVGLTGFSTRRKRSRPSASSAASAIPPWTTPSLPGSDAAATAGPIAT
jgi:hypothetical protein